MCIILIFVVGIDISLFRKHNGPPERKSLASRTKHIKTYGLKYGKIKDNNKERCREYYNKNKQKVLLAQEVSRKINKSKAVLIAENEKEKNELIEELKEGFNFSYEQNLKDCFTYEKEEE